jgi:hypothetical protein
VLVTGQNALDQADSERELDAKWQRAIDLREFPDTVLAHGIFTNMQKYPDDIILTRVGMFYEVSMEALYSPGRLTNFSRIPSPVILYASS